MKYTILAIAAVIAISACKSQQPAPQPPPPMVDMGMRSGK